jgi:hypothetical protein
MVCESEKNQSIYMQTPNYTITRGAYNNSTDDRADRWYIQLASGPVNRSGNGYRTRALASDALNAMLAGHDISAMPRD